jgi:hypothetical protein
MFNITESMLETWQKQNEPKAFIIDISRIEMVIREKLPAPYVEFIANYGYVIFGEDAEQKYHFDYSIKYPDRIENHEGNIAFLHNADQVITAYRNMTLAEFEHDETRPVIPANYLPIGNDMGQGQILIELGEHAGRVWYWPFNEWAWGTEDNTWLGFVADNFYDFINRLRP